ncbi:MAG: leucine-rich repeat domain-containing protein [Muribaculaceae bacterium]|nr:leucine-rich repeat domain-containing protein [Muribaculaceae bacterium]
MIRRFLATLTVLVAIGACAYAQPRNITPTITWEVVDTILYIRGTGDMPNFGISTTPWLDGSAYSCTEIVVGEGITSVGEFAFCNDVKAFRKHMDADYYRRAGFRNPRTDVMIQSGCLPSVRRVHLPSTLREIDANAFQGLLIRYINIPDSVKRIGALAFNLTDLRYVELPAGLEHLGYSAFESCVNLHCVDFRGASIRVPKGAFFACERLWQIMNTSNITDVNPIGVESTPVEPFGGLLKEMLGLSNYMRYKSMNLIPWGDYVRKFLPNPPKMTSAQRSEIDKAVKRWKRERHNRFTAMEYNEFVDSLWTECAEENINDFNDQWIENHQVLRAKWETDEEALYDDYCKALVNGKTMNFRSDMFELGDYNEDMQCFDVTTTHHGGLRLMVPADKADKVRRDWNWIRRNVAPKYVARGEEVVLRNALFSAPDGSVYAAAPIR